MARISEEALINPELLRWAREALGVPAAEAARGLRVPEERLLRWESGDEPISVAKLKRAAAYYRRPLASFYLPEPPRGSPNAPPDFRGADSLGAGAGSALALQIRTARERREVAVELASEIDDPIAPFDLTIDRGLAAGEAAERLREWIGVSLEEQLAWKDPRAALKRWRAALESRGLLTFQFSDVPVAEARGFSFYELPFPVVAVNSKDLPVARIFSLIHELAHLALRGDGLCDFAGGLDGAEALAEERYCNAVAAAFLVPSRAVVGADKDASVADVDRLAAEFKVSKEAIALRLISEGLATWSLYEKVRGRYFEEVRAESARLKDKDGGPSPTRRALTNLGSRFVGLVVSAYHEEVITAPEFRDYADVRIKKLGEIEGMLAQGG